MASKDDDEWEEDEGEEEVEEEAEPSLQRKGDMMESEILQQSEGQHVSWFCCFQFTDVYFIFTKLLQNMTA